MDVRLLVGRNFSRLRRAKGFTQIAFCDATGLHQADVSALERGAANPTVTTLARLATALAVEPAELLVLDDVARQELAMGNGGKPI